MKCDMVNNKTTRSNSPGGNMAFENSPFKLTQAVLFPSVAVLLLLAAATAIVFHFLWCCYCDYC